jgi:hypothetical protein
MLCKKGQANIWPYLGAVVIAIIFIILAWKFLGLFPSF